MSHVKREDNKATYCLYNKGISKPSSLRDSGWSLTQCDPLAHCFSFLAQQDWNHLDWVLNGPKGRGEVPDGMEMGLEVCMRVLFSIAFPPSTSVRHTTHTSHEMGDVNEIMLS
jgi:hypothetical protein